MCKEEEIKETEVGENYGIEEEINGMNKVDKKMKRFKCAFSKKEQGNSLAVQGFNPWLGN